MRKGFALALVATLALANVEAKSHHHHHKQPATTAPAVVDSSDYSTDLSGSDYLDASGSGKIYLDGDLSDDASVDASGSQIDVDYSSSEDISFDSSASFSGSDEYDASIDIEEGSVEMEVSDSEDIDQSMDIAYNQVVDETIDLPRGAKQVRLRVHNGNIDLEIIKMDKIDKPVVEKKAETAPTTADEHKDAAAPAKTSDVSESFSQQATSWVKSNASSPVFIGCAVGAAAAMAAVAVMAVAKSRKRSSPRSVLTLEAGSEEIDAATEEQDEDAEEDEDEDSSEEEEVASDELTKADKAEGVVEGSV